MVSSAHVLATAPLVLAHPSLTHTSTATLIIISHNYFALYPSSSASAVAVPFGLAFGQTLDRWRDPYVQLVAHQQGLRVSMSVFFSLPCPRQLRLQVLTSQLLGIPLGVM